ncbi:succinate dehydrogenase/fumarate reductase flavoprotein subunit [Mycolicibacterium fluoranthenivorans]|uniref:Succinate dehydrogenase/fumarate reductase flavoprotein subunit n=1 Tax=Mycolicibacterium fluoranthenivorans TaxID=258505 RepID=A0A7X5ZE41_9MYCO|nr:succinate dehydrogenase/fumarate reductase flavoprotein subunit [Mycolicibacterium fluoranthenivorans]
MSGAAAAVEAARSGADVLVLERSGSWGGAAAMAGGFIYLGGGTPIQKACGFEDSPDNMATFLNAAMGPGADAPRIEDYCAGSIAHFEWLVGCGVPFKAEFFGEPGWEPMGDEGLMYSGGENAYPFNTIANPAPRGHVPQMQNKKQGESSAGLMLMKGLVDSATAAGARALYDIRVQRLIIESDGRVAGIRSRRYGETIDIRARRGVVLAAGSFAYNDAMVAQYAPRIAGRPPRSNSMTGRPFGWPRPSAPTSPTWTPPRWHCSSTHNNWCAASWSTNGVNATSPRTPTQTGPVSSRSITRTTPRI